MSKKDFFSNFLDTTREYPVEFQILFLMSRQELGSQSLQFLQKCLTQPLNWPAILCLGRLNGVSPLLYQTIKQLNFPCIPNSEIHLLTSEVLSYTSKNTVYAQKLVELVSGFSKAEILAIPFKGPALAQAHYQDINLRTFTDLDFWVHPRQYKMAVTWLQTQGFVVCEELPWEGLLYDPQTDISVDLHQAITSNQFSFRLSFEQVSDRLEPLALQGQTIQYLSPEDSLLVQCVNWCKDAWGRSARLGQLCDIAAILNTNQNLDWDYLTKLARQLDAENILLLPLLLAHHWLGALLPQDLYEKAHHSSNRKKLINYINEHFYYYTGSSEDVGQQVSTRDHTFYFGLRPGLMARLLYLLRQIIIPTDREEELIHLPNKLNFLYIPLRFIRLIWKYSMRLASQPSKN